MKNLFARIAGLSRLTKTLLTAAGALLALAIIAGVVLATNPALGARLSGNLAGATAENWKPAIYATNGKCLSTTTEWLGQTGKYQVRTWECDESPLPENKRWESVLETDGKSTRLKSQAGGAEVCLDVEGGKAANGATVTTFPCKTSDYSNQLWIIEPIASAPDHYQIRAASSSYCLFRVDQYDAHTWVQLQDCGNVYNTGAKYGAGYWRFTKR